MIEQPHAVFSPGLLLESSHQLPPDYLPDDSVDFFLQDLFDYLQERDLLYEKTDLVNSLKLMCLFNGLEQHLSIAEGVAFPTNGNLSMDGFRAIHACWIGPLGQALGNIKNLTEKPVTLITMSRPRYDTETLRTIYYDPSKGQEVPYVNKSMQAGENVWGNE